MAEYPESLFPEIADPLKKAFLASYAHTGRITKAGKACGVGWRNHYNWMAADPVYATAFATAKRMAGDFLEDEAVRRAMEGITKRVYYKGDVVDEVQEFSDLLMIFLLKGAKPDTYREHVDIRLSQAQAAEQIASEYGMDVKELRARAERRLLLVEQKRLDPGQEGTA